MRRSFTGPGRRLIMRCIMQKMAKNSAWEKYILKFYILLAIRRNLPVICCSIEQGKPHAIFTGDTLFVGDVGRPDLLDGVMSSETLASMMYDSLTKKIKTLPDDVIVYPAHGPGSACGKNIGKETFSTIGEQKKFNYALQDMSRAEFVAKITEGILPPPPYFYEDARINKTGYDPIEDVIRENSKPLSLEQFNE